MELSGEEMVLGLFQFLEWTKEVVELQVALCCLENQGYLQWCESQQSWVMIGLFVYL